MAAIADGAEVIVLRESTLQSFEVMSGILGDLMRTSADEPQVPAGLTEIGGTIVAVPFPELDGKGLGELYAEFGMPLDGSEPASAVIEGEVSQ